MPVLRVETKEREVHFVPINEPVRDVKVLVKKAILSLDLSLRDVREARVIPNK